MDIMELLEARGLDASARVKMLRHKDKTCDVKALYDQGFIEFYQSLHSDNRLECDYVVSFLGLEGSEAVFIGVWRVKGKIERGDLQVPIGYLHTEHYTEHNDVFYDLEEVGGFEDIKDRAIIDWGPAALSWHQWCTPKPVLRLLPTGYVSQFPGYLDFVLTFNQLKAIIKNPSANRIWHNMLGAVSGIYLITDTKTGGQYVGSASGQKGILGRWSEYTRAGHGGNKLFKKLLRDNPGYEQHFQFTILRTLPSTLTKREVIKIEVLYKKKLGVIARALNAN